MSAEISERSCVCVRGPCDPREGTIFVEAHVTSVGCGGTRVPSRSEPACVFISPVSLPSTDVHASQSERGSVFAHGGSEGTGAGAQTWHR